MPANRKLPPIEELERLYREGHTYAEIGDMYGATKTAVSKKFERAGRTPKRVTYRDLLPWKIAPEHRNAALMRRVRAMANKQSGIAISVNEERLLAEWITGMTEAGMILNYHPEAPPNAASTAGGFYYSPRKNGEAGLFRLPGK